MKSFSFTKPSDVRVGVIGYGGQFNMGRIHLNDMAKAGMTPSAVAEIDPARLAVASTDFPGIATYKTVAEMLKKAPLDLVVIITPHNTHFDLAMQCLKAGKHVVCEKPLCITTVEADKLVAEAKRRGLLLTAFHNRHWDGLVVEAVRQVRSGAIGKVLRVDARMGQYHAPRQWWRSSRSISGGILYDWGVHLLEYALQILHPCEIAEVSGFSTNGYWSSKPKAPYPDDANEDEAHAEVRMKDGRRLSLTITSIDQNPKPGLVEITGTEGTLVMDHRAFTRITINKKGETVRVSGSNPGDAWEHFYQNIADYLTGKEELVVTPEWSRRMIHILDLAGQSARLGRALMAKHS